MYAGKYMHVWEYVCMCVFPLRNVVSLYFSDDYDSVIWTYFITYVSYFCLLFHKHSWHLCTLRKVWLHIVWDRQATH